MGSASSGAKAHYLLKRIADYLPSGVPLRLLDYGAGGGGFLHDAQARGWEVQGYEPGRRGLEICRKSGLTVTNQLEDLSRNYFSLVTLHHVFEHVADPISMLCGIAQTMRPDGRLFIEVPNIGSLRARLAFSPLSQYMNIDERYRAFPIHLMYYNRQTLQRMLERAGWSVEGQFTVGLGLDEYFIRANHRISCPDIARHGTSHQKRRLRHAIRDIYLRTGLGENLAVIARPTRQ
jgi:2-polyprenyl-3-methyl-5-hydroxy-6-metoxy-1,4-benzoquinol methylase